MGTQSPFFQTTPFLGLAFYGKERFYKGNNRPVQDDGCSKAVQSMSDLIHAQLGLENRLHASMLRPFGSGDHFA
jgi:hypothetical protein